MPLVTNRIADQYDPSRPEDPTVGIWSSSPNDGNELCTDLGEGKHTLRWRETPLAYAITTVTTPMPQKNWKYSEDSSMGQSGTVTTGSFQRGRCWLMCYTRPWCTARSVIIDQY